ncbi:UNVERIFIED_CONTAM: putative polygalacturonase [Sesamum calycinum]|uniref:Polygalacturonase n=1 Tax=Sesamum calycinum TaxID=2727403 RepID=A0AAW2MM56_9LAMI
MMEGENPLANAIRANFTRPSWAFLLLIFTGPGWRGPEGLRVAPGSLRPPAAEGGEIHLRVWRSGRWEDFQYGSVPEGDGVHGEIQGTGGTQLNVPKGRWLTGSFNLTSDFTLFLEDGAVILGSQVTPCLLGLDFGSHFLSAHGTTLKNGPSSRRCLHMEEGERGWGGHISLIHGNSLTNVVITGHNGTIDGQGKMWWDLWWNKTLEYTRGHLVELINSHNILISNLTFRNSPFWTIHPVYSRSGFICNHELFAASFCVQLNFSSLQCCDKNMTILAPLHAPNTDGIDPDSSTDVCIEDCYIESGDDLVAVKSGWDHYGIRMARPERKHNYKTSVRDNSNVFRHWNRQRDVWWN